MHNITEREFISILNSASRHDWSKKTEWKSGTIEKIVGRKDLCDITIERSLYNLPAVKKAFSNFLDKYKKERISFIAKNANRTPYEPEEAIKPNAIKNLLPPDEKFITKDIGFALATGEGKGEGILQRGSLARILLDASDAFFNDKKNQAPKDPALEKKRKRNNKTPSSPPPTKQRRSSFVDAVNAQRKEAPPERLLFP